MKCIGQRKLWVWDARPEGLNVGRFQSSFQKDQWFGYELKDFIKNRMVQCRKLVGGLITGRLIKVKFNNGFTGLEKLRLIFDFICTIFCRVDINLIMHSINSFIQLTVHVVFLIFCT